MKVIKQETVITEDKVTMNVHVNAVSIAEIIILASKLQKQGFKLNKKH